MLLSTMFSICKIYDGLGGSVREQLNEVQEANELFPNENQDDLFIEVVAKQNRNAMRYAVDGLKEMSSCLSDPQLDDAIINFYLRIEKALNCLYSE